MRPPPWAAAAPTVAGCRAPAWPARRRRRSCSTARGAWPTDEGHETAVGSQHLHPLRRCTSTMSQHLRRPYLSASRSSRLRYALRSRRDARAPVLSIATRCAQLRRSDCGHGGALLSARRPRPYRRAARASLDAPMLLAREAPLATHAVANAAVATGTPRIPLPSVRDFTQWQRRTSLLWLRCAVRCGICKVKGTEPVRMNILSAHWLPQRLLAVRTV